MPETPIGINLMEISKAGDRLVYLQAVQAVYTEHPPEELSLQEITEGITFATKNGLVDRQEVAKVMNCQGKCLGKLECDQDDHSFEERDFKEGFAVVINQIDAGIKDHMQSMAH